MFPSAISNAPDFTPPKLITPVASSTPNATTRTAAPASTALSHPGILPRSSLCSGSTTLATSSIDSSSLSKSSIVLVRYSIPTFMAFMIATSTFLFTSAPSFDGGFNWSCAFLSIASCGVFPVSRK